MYDSLYGDTRFVVEIGNRTCNVSKMSYSPNTVLQLQPVPGAEQCFRAHDNSGGRWGLIIPISQLKKQKHDMVRKVPKFSTEEKLVGRAEVQLQKRGS